MIRIVSKLVIIFLVLYAVTSVGYSRLEKWLLADLPQQKKSRPAPTMAVEQAAPVEEAKEKAIDYSIIITRNIFQAALEGGNVPELEKPIDIEVLGPADLPISLQGTVTGDNKTARAIILDEKTKKQNIYHLGDSIQGAVIKAIERGKVVLQVNGRNEVLQIMDRKGEPGNGAAAGNSRGSRLTSGSRSAVPRNRVSTPVRPTPKRRMTVRQPAPLLDGAVPPDSAVPPEPMENETHMVQEPGDELPSEDIPPPSEESGGDSSVPPDVPPTEE